MTKFKTNKNKKAKAFTVNGVAALIIAAILAAALLFTGCNQPSGSSSGGGGTPPTPPAPPNAGSFEPAGDGFIKIIPPTTGIVGVDPDSLGYPLPGSVSMYGGVFIKDRTVKLSPYKLGKTEVTYELWYSVLKWNTDNGKGYVFANKGLEGWDGTGGGGNYPDYTNIGKPPTGNKNHPVTMINWRDCIVWCNAYTEMKMGKDECVYRKSDSDSTVLKDAKAKEGEVFICDKAYADMSKKGFRLPTEAEWEYAARWQGSDKTNADKYGDVWLTKLNSASGAKDKWDTDETGKVAWYNGNSGGKTHSVGQKSANKLGLYDMSGNVWEWCWDWSGSIASGDVTDPQGAASGAYRVGRGGGWYLHADHCSVGRRGEDSPGSRFNLLGFRLACRP